MLVSGLCSTSDDWPGWSMDSNPVHHPSPAKKMKYLFLDYIQLLMISRAGRWTRTPSATPLQPKNKMLVFGLHSTSDDRPGWSMDSNPICHPSPAKKIKCSFLNYVPTSDGGPGWSMDSKPICHPSLAKKIKCSFLDYIQLLVIAGLVDGLKPRPPPLSSQKNEMLVSGLRSTSDDWPDCSGLRSTSDDWPDWSMDSNPVHHPCQAKKNEMLVFGLRSLLMTSRAG